MIKIHSTQLVFPAVSGVFAILLLLTAGYATAQPGTWIGGDGNWSDTANWFDADVPNTATESASITNGSAVLLDGSFTIEGLTLGSLDSLELPNASDLFLNANVTNYGSILLNGTGSGTEFRTNVDATLAGIGELVIGTDGVNPAVNIIGANSAVASPVLTNSAGHTIRALGIGTLGRQTTAIVNEGLIVADGASANLLINPNSSTGGLTNTSTIRATNNAQIEIRNLINNTGGLIETLGGGQINLGNSADVVGGGITGNVTVIGAAKISDLTTSAAIDVVNDADFQAAGTITNQGVIALNGTGSGTEFRTNVDATLAGTGELVIGTDGVNPAVNIIGANSAVASPVLTNSAGHTIRALGIGTLGRQTTAIVNEGLIVADGASANLLINPNSSTGGLTNTSTIRATNNAQIEIRNLINNTGGLIEGLSGGQINLGNSADVVGGEITGNVSVIGAAQISNLTTSAAIDVVNDADFQAAGTITNQGVIALNGTGSGTEFRTNVDVTLAGTGELVIGADGVNFGVNIIGASSAAASPVLTNSANHTIRALGIGTLGRATTAIVNEGQIIADGASANLIVTPHSVNGGLTNTGTIQATNNALLELRNLTTNSGIIRATNGSRVEVAATANENGLFEAIGTGSVVQRTAGSVAGLLDQPGDSLRAIDGGVLNLIDTPAFDSDTSSNAGSLEFVGVSSYTDIFNDDIIPRIGNDPGETGGPLAGISSPGDLRSLSFTSNSGTFRIGGGLDFTARGRSGGFTNTGTIVAGEGSIFAAAGYSGGFITGGGGGSTFLLSSFSSLVSTGTLAGSGEIRNANTTNSHSADIGGDILSSDGFIQPGDNPGETGTLTLFALDILLGDSNVINIELGDGEHDTLVLSTAEFANSEIAPSTVALNGALEVSLLSSYVPTAGDSFEIITAVNGLAGSFETITLPTLTGGLEWLVDYTANAVAIELFLPGDYNGNGVVDAADYTVWRNNLGAPAGTLPNDIDGGVIGTDHYATWKDNYVAGLDATALARSTVPEPTSLLLIGVCSLMLARRCRIA